MSGKPTMCLLTDYMILGGVENVIRDALPILSKNFNITLVNFFGDATPRLKTPAGVKAELS